MTIEMVDEKDVRTGELADRIISEAQRLSRDYGMMLDHDSVSFSRDMTVVTVSLGKGRDPDGTMCRGFGYMAKLRNGKIIEEELFQLASTSEAKRAYGEFKRNIAKGETDLTDSAAG